jgi:hypothetical protein
MPELTGFGTFAGTRGAAQRKGQPPHPLGQASDDRMVEHRGRRPCRAASHANEQIVWMLKGKMEFRLGSEQRVCSAGDVLVIPRGTEHEAWFRKDTEVIDFFAPPSAEGLLGGKPA